MVACGVTDIVEVVVLAAGPHAFLRRRGPAVGAALCASKHILELHHARIGEHQGGIIARHKRGRRNNLVSLRLEKIKKSRAYLGKAGHLKSNSLAEETFGMLFR